MKKIVTIAGVIVLGWLGLTAYISNVFKGEFEQYIERLNRVYASQGILYKTEVQSSFFTSDVKLEVHLDKDRLGKAAADVYAEFISLPVELEYKVEHGPVFYKDGFGIGFAKFNAEMKASEVVAGKLKENLLERVPEDITLHLTEILSFDKRLKVDMHSDAVTLIEKGEKVEIASLVGSGVVDIETLLGSFDVTLPKISLEGNGITATAQDITLHVAMKDMLKGKYLLGDGVFKVGKVRVEQDALAQPLEMDFMMDVKTEREDENLFMTAIDMQLNQEGFEQLSPTAKEIAKQVNFSIQWNGISVEVLQKVEVLNKKQTEALDSLYAVMELQDQSQVAEAQQKAELAQEAFAQAAKEAFQALLIKERTKLSVGMDLTTKDNATSKISVSAGYVGKALQGDVEEMVAYLQQKPLEYLTVNAELHINEKHFALNPSPQEQQQAKMGFDMAVMQGMMRFENGVYSTKLEYAPKTLKINGQDKSQEILPLIEMSLSQRTMN
ncbi:DUF945 family protein [Sulfurovum mangrovi]|uniref:DUF945 family protein n=1 Tax=Sulfurovum mangrovi TaxID=2893889 RepID=UPI001E6370A0|nr:DUF945 family protein [Sulfurovum mangrovi]UFH59273.1 YdgA family protein [Sulfurovum mangrovi]